MKNIIQKTTVLILSAFILCSSICKKDTAYLDKQEAQNAFVYLNQIRVSPSSYSDEIGVDLSYVGTKQELIWNDTLALVAEKKALDMANRNYYGHVDPDGNGINIKINNAGYSLPESWYSDKSLNYFESIGAGYNSGVELIKALIIDEGLNPPGHRNHLLGIGDFWSNCYDIGIGFAKTNDADFPTYCCIIIAKHDF